MFATLQFLGMAALLVILLLLDSRGFFQSAAGIALLICGYVAGGLVLYAFF